MREIVLYHIIEIISVCVKLWSLLASKKLLFWFQVAHRIVLRARKLQENEYNEVRKQGEGNRFGRRELDKLERD